MEPISLDDVRDRHRTGDEPYDEFLREDSMSLGRYVIPAGGADRQSPHTEDEAYVVLDGRAHVHIGDDEYPVEAGDVVFVEKHVDHRFVDIESDLELLVVFAPPEGTLTSDRPG